MIPPTIEEIYQIIGQLLQNKLNSQPFMNEAVMIDSQKLTEDQKLLTKSVGVNQVQNYDSRKIVQAYAADEELGISKSRIYKSGLEINCDDTLTQVQPKGPYDKNYLNEFCKSRDYLKSVSYTVNMNGLMKVKQSYAYHLNHKHHPVLVEIISEQLKDIYGGQYLLQIWSSDGKMVYQKVLKYEPRCVNVFHDVVIYSLDANEGEERLVYIVFLNKDCARAKVHDFSPDNSYKQIGYSQGYVYMANDIQLVIAKTVTEKTAAQYSDKVFAPEAASIYNIILPPGRRMLKFYNVHSFTESDPSRIYCAVEFEDHQVSYQKLLFLDADRGFQFNAVKDIHDRPAECALPRGGSDPITKFCLVVGKRDKVHAMALRGSGLVDLYHSSLLVTSSTEVYDDIHLTFRSGYLLKKTPEDVEAGKKAVLNVFHIKNKRFNSRLGFDEIVDEGQTSASKWNLIPFSILKYHLKLISSLLMYKSVLLMSHQQFLSVYDLRYNKWVHSIDFGKDKEVQRIILMPGEKIMVGLSDATWATLVEAYPDDPNDMTMKLDHPPEKKFGENSKIEKIVTDQNDYNRFYCMVRDAKSNKKRMFILNKEFTEDSKIKINDDDVLIKYFTEENEKQFYMLLNIKLKQVTFRHFGEKDPKKEIKTIKLSGKDFVKGEFIENAISNNNLYDGLLFLFGQETVYTVDLAKAEITQLDAWNLANLTLIDNHYLYTMMNESSDQSPGFYIQSINTFLNPKTKRVDLSKAFKIKSTIGGQSSILKYFYDQDKIAIQSDFQSVRILPIIHRNTLSFYGMKPSTSYLAFTRLDDVLIGLDKHRTLTTWSIVTAKVKGSFTFDDELDLKGYMRYPFNDNKAVFHRDWYQDNILLWKEVPNSDKIDYKQFFGNRFKPGMNGGRSALENEPIKIMSMKLIEIAGPKSIHLHFQFEHPYFTDTSYERIFFSDDRQLMLEKFETTEVFLFKREDQPGFETTREVKWILIRRFINHQTDLSEFSEYNYLYSPNLQLYFDCDNSKSVYQIRSSMDKTVVVEIPKGILNTKYEVSTKLVKKFRWMSNTDFKMINSDGLEKRYRIASKGFFGKEFFLEEVGFGHIQMFDPAPVEDTDLSYHYYFDTKSVLESPDQIFERLVRKQQLYSSAVNVDGITDPVSRYNVLFTPDFNTQGSKKRKLVLDQSFTYLHWKMAEALPEKDIKFEIKQLSRDEIKLLALNIFPQGKTVVHYLFNSIEQLKILYQKTSTKDRYYDPIAVPFIKDFQDKSPLHLTVEAENEQGICIILDLIKNDPIDNHGRAINDIFPDIVQTNSATLDDYLKARILQTDTLSRLDKGKLKVIQWTESSLVAASQWPDFSEIKEGLLEPSKDGSKIMNDISVKIIDIPEIHGFSTDTGGKFFDSLAEIDNLNLFLNPVVKSTIDYKWPLVRFYTILWLFIPFLIQLGAFIAFSNVFCGQLGPSNELWPAARTGNIALIIILYVLAIYFLSIEIIQIAKQGIPYFFVIWNLQDIVVPSLIILVITYRLKEWQDTTGSFEIPVIIYSAHAAASLLLWSKFLYFLRIFESTGYMVRMLIKMCYDIRIFLFVLIIVYIAFGEAFLRISEMEDEQFIQNNVSDGINAEMSPGATLVRSYGLSFIFSFLISLGAGQVVYNGDNTQQATLYILMVLCTTVTMIIMLNLLIAILGKSFDEIYESAIQASYQERAKLISENMFLIPGFAKNMFCSASTYLFMAEDLSIDNKFDDNEETKEQMSAIREQLGKMAKKNDEIDSRITEILEVVDPSRKQSLPDELVE